MMLGFVSCDKQKGQVVEDVVSKDEDPKEVKIDPIIIALLGHDNMTYTGGDSFEAKVGGEINLTLKNAGKLPIESMGHNLVVLKPGIDHAEFGGQSFKAKANDYIPAAYSSSIIAHTKLLGPGESDKITFKIEEAGDYTFVCSFPGHFGTMKGKIIVK